jgi:hypothetical protein
MHTNLNNYIVLAVVHHKQTFGHVTLVNNYLHMVFLSWFGVMVLNATFNNTSIISSEMYPPQKLNGRSLM